MPREISTITKKDLIWYEINKAFRKVIKTKKDWKKWIAYMEVYYK